MSKVRANLFTNKNNNGSPEFPFGLISSGIVTATSFVGDGSGLTGVSGSGGIVNSYSNVLSSDLTLSAPNLTHVVDVDQDLTFDIEPGVEVSVDEGCFFVIRSA
jgi:hypothetical protein